MILAFSKHFHMENLSKIVSFFETMKTDTFHKLFVSVVIITGSQDFAKVTFLVVLCSVTFHFIKNSQFVFIYLYNYEKAFVILKSLSFKFLVL